MNEKILEEFIKISVELGLKITTNYFVYFEIALEKMILEKKYKKISREISGERMVSIWSVERALSYTCYLIENSSFY